MIWNKGYRWYPNFDNVDEDAIEKVSKNGHLEVVTLLFELKNRGCNLYIS